MRLAAERLAERLCILVNDMPEDNGLNHVVCRYLEGGGRREDIYPRLRTVMKDLQLPTPEPLRKLAQIRHFNLYVTTTFDLLGRMEKDRFRVFDKLYRLTRLEKAMIILGQTASNLLR